MLWLAGVLVVALLRRVQLQKGRGIDAGDVGIWLAVLGIGVSEFGSTSLGLGLTVGGTVLAFAGSFWPRPGRR
jgi:hypothetical protein